MDAVFLKILNMSLTASWIVLAVLLLRLLLRKAPKWLSCLLWGVIGLRLIFPFSIESLFSLIPSAEPLPSDLPMTQTPAIDSGFEVIDQVVNPIIYDSFAPTPTVSVNPMQIAIAVAAIVWLCGLVGMIAYGVISYLRLRLRVRASICQDGNVYLCDDIDSPFILGVIRPRIYLPSGMTQEQMDYVIGHEQAHLRRLDHIWKPVGFALLCLHWFNPMLWVAYILLCRDIEKACDEKVIRDMDDESKKGYSETLVACSVHRRAVMACPLAFGEVGVKERIKSVLNYKKPAFWIILVAVVVLIVTGVCFLTDPLSKVPFNNGPQEPEYINSGTTADGVNWFVGTILEINDYSFLVEPAEGTPERQSADKIVVPRATSSDDDNDILRNLCQGEEIYVCYTGGIAESYPAQINKAQMIVPRWNSYTDEWAQTAIVDIDEDGEQEYCKLSYGAVADNGEQWGGIFIYDVSQTQLEYVLYLPMGKYTHRLIVRDDGTLWYMRELKYGSKVQQRLSPLTRRTTIQGVSYWHFGIYVHGGSKYDDVVQRIGGEPMPGVVIVPSDFSTGYSVLEEYTWHWDKNWDLKIQFRDVFLDDGSIEKWAYNFYLAPREE